MSNRLRRAAEIQDQSGRYIPNALPAPVLGWNARDSLDGMPPGFGVQLDNFIPYNGYVSLRGGSRLVEDEFGAPVQTLARWADATNEKVLAGANGQIWDVVFGSKTSLGSGFTVNDWQWDNTKGARGTGAKLYLVNGVDTPQVYDGTTLAAVTWAAKSGQPALTIDNLQNIRISKDIIFLAERNELGFWHSDKGNVAPNSELSWFDLGTILPEGGELVSIASYTLEGGDGPDDYTVFVASTGWTALYRGNDPAQATEWSLVGVYTLGKALGRRCTLEIAGDVIVLTVNGYISMRQFIQIGGLERQSFAFNDNIQPEVVRQTIAYKGEFGWQAVLVPDLTVALFNVPQSSGNFVQHVVNTQTGAWGRLKSLNAQSWLVTNELLLLGTTDGKILTANEPGIGTDVDNSAIVGEAMTAFSYLGQRGVRKLFQMYRPIIETQGEVSVQMTVGIDFDLNTTSPAPAGASGETSAVWDDSDWDVGEWAGAARTRTDWFTIGRLGYAVAVKLIVESTGDTCRWKSTDISHTPGGLL